MSITFSASVKKAINPTETEGAAAKEERLRAEMMRCVAARRENPDDLALARAYDRAFNAWKKASEDVVAEMRKQRAGR